MQLRIVLIFEGRSAKLKDVGNVDWIPTLAMGHRETSPDNQSTEFPDQPDLSTDQPDLSTETESITSDKCDKCGQSIPKEAKETKDAGAQTYETYAVFSPTDTITLLPTVTTPPNAPPTTSSTKTKIKTRTDGTQTETKTFSTIGTQTNEYNTGMSAEIIVTLEDKIKLLEEMLSKHRVTIESFEGDDMKTCFFTGLTKFVTMKELFLKIEGLLPTTTKLTQFEIFFIFLARMRLNLTFRYFSYQFNVSGPTISKYFYKCLFVMFSKLRSLIYWPEREALRKTMPLCFQLQFGKKIVTIVDCFEIFVEKPSELKAAAQLWSQYKHAYTVKYFIGITPQGSVMFISTGYGGRCSDKIITNKCTFLDKLVVGDVVMADRGFLIEEELKGRGVELNIPAFTKGKAQLDALDIEDTRNIANVRIHVERIIGLIRKKYSILHQFKFPLHMVTKQITNPHVLIIDQIVTVACALTNLCSPTVGVVPEDLSSSILGTIPDVE